MQDDQLRDMVKLDQERCRVIDLLQKETKDLEQKLEVAILAMEKWNDYFLPDVGPPGDEDKSLLFNEWTIAQKEALDKLRDKGDV